MSVELRMANGESHIWHGSVELPDVKQCATCKWWELITTTEVAGVCLKMDSDGLLSESTMALASAYDHACVLTLPIFGCNQWEPKEPNPLS